MGCMGLKLECQFYSPTRANVYASMQPNARPPTVNASASNEKHCRRSTFSFALCSRLARANRTTTTRPTTLSIIGIAIVVVVVGPKKENGFVAAGDRLAQSLASSFLVGIFAGVVVDATAVRPSLLGSSVRRFTGELGSNPRTTEDPRARSWQPAYA